MKPTVTMTDNRTGKTYEFEIKEATRGPSVVDISSFYAQTGMFTFDNGYTSTASCKSTITFIDGAWISQWIEFKKDTSTKIARPRQLYLGV